MALEEGKLVAKVTSGGLRVRKQPNLDADVLDLAAEGDTFEIVEQLDGWIGIEYSSDTVAYISADYVKSDFELGKAISIEEELAAMQAAREEAAIKAAQEAAAKERANQQNVQTASTDIATVTGASVEADYDDTYLLACLIHMEAGGEPYEGKFICQPPPLVKAATAIFLSKIDALLSISQTKDNENSVSVFYFVMKQQCK